LITPHPRRVQQRRGVPGWRKPEGARSVARPGRFGNPFTTKAAVQLGQAEDEDQARALVVDAFADWLDTGRCIWPIDNSEERRQRLLDGLPGLAGCLVMCFCPLDKVCHADELLRRVDQLRGTVS
jgi:hypothetical protein